MKSLALLCCALLPLTLPAQNAPGTSTTPPLVETVITAASAEIWSNEPGTETYAIFNGNVVVTGTNMRITCDRIEVTAEGSKAETTTPPENATARDVDKFKTVIATGKVRIVQGDREANCERAEVFPREGKIILTGNPVVIDHGANVVFTGEPLILLKGERRVLGENVKFTFPPVNDLGFDKDAPAPQPDPAAVPSP